MHPSTLSVHGGAPAPRVGEPVVMPIDRSVIHRLDDGVYRARAEGDPEARVYGRELNPTVRQVEERLAALEGAQRALLFSSGQAALHTLVMGVVRRGDKVVAASSIYGGSTDLLRHLVPQIGATLVELNVNRPGALERELKAADKVSLVFCESIGNPLTEVTDLPLVVEAVRSHGKGALLAVDATLASPVGQRPLDFGADVVLHSGTKYLGGHSDLLAGVLAGSDPTLKPLWEGRTRAGGCIDPGGAWLLERGLKTLALRVERQSANALALARFLDTRGEVAVVHYCGLAKSPENDRARRLLRHTGGLLSFVLEGGDGAARSLVDGLRLFANAASLGGVESLASRPRQMSHAHLREAERLALGLFPGLVRLSVGIEDVRDLIDDLTQALPS